jgi:hypothetical protein
LSKTTSELAEEVIGIYDFNASFEIHDFEMQVYDDRDWERSNSIMLRVQFLDSKAEKICPIFDTFIRDFKVVH